MPASARTIEITTGSAGVADLAAVWQEVERRCGLRHVFDRHPMAVIAAAAAEATGSQPLVAIVRDADGRPRTLLPLRAAGLYGTRSAHMLTAPLGQYSDVVGEPLSPAAFAAVCNRLRSEHGLALILFRRVRDDSGLKPALRELGRPQNAATTAPCIDLAAFARFAAYEASFSGATRRSRRQRRDKLIAAHGPLAFEVLTGAEGAPYIEQAIAWKQTWLAGQGLKSAVLDRGPWTEALRACGRQAGAITSVLFAGGRPVAIELGFLTGALYTSYLGAYDASLARFSVGQEQMLRTIAWAFAAGAARYDLMAPADAYKRQWTRTDARAVGVDDYAVPLNALGRGMAEVRRHARPAARSLVLNIRPEVRAAGSRFAKPAAIAAAAISVAALAVD